MKVYYRFSFWCCTECNVHHHHQNTNIINTNVADVAVTLLLRSESLIEYKPWDSVSIYA